MHGGPNIPDIAAAMRLRTPGDFIPQSAIHPPQPIQAVQPLQAPTRYLVVPGIPLLLGGATSPGERLEFSGRSGWIVGWRGTAVTPGAVPQAGVGTQALTEVNLAINGEEFLITNGAGAAAGTFADLFAADVQWSPLMRYMKATDVIFTQITNLNVAASVQASLTFAFIGDGDYPGTG